MSFPNFGENLLFFSKSQSVLQYFLSVSLTNQYKPVLHSWLMKVPSILHVSPSQYQIELSLRQSVYTAVYTMAANVL